jgi:hypothetical protein
VLGDLALEGRALAISAAEPAVEVVECFRDLSELGACFGLVFSAR